MKPRPELAQTVKFEPLETSKARWIQLNKINYKNPEGKLCTWECASRKTRTKETNCDAVGIIAIIDGADPKLILQKQFRPPVEGVCIEMPAGLIDPNESIETCALRELKEETGYVGEIVQTTPVMSNDPGFSNTNMALVSVKVDMQDERNKNPVTELEENEFIETFTVSLKNLNKELERLDSEGYVIDARVQSVAAGIHLSKVYSL